MLVANAGLPGSGTLPRLEPADIDRVLEVNLRAPIMLARLLVPGMIERGRGQLVFVASFAGKVPSAGESSIYTATKFGLRGFAHVLRAQLKRKGVGVSLVTPGPVRDAGMFARGGGKTPPLIKPSSPEDVGKAVVRAIERNAAEIDVASLGLRAISKVGALAPATVRRPHAAEPRWHRPLGGRVRARRRRGPASLPRRRMTREREVAAMEHARAHGYPVPAARALSDTDIVMERVDGPTMLDDLARRPWSCASRMPPRSRGSTSSCTRSRRRHGLPAPFGDGTRCCISICTPTT